MNIEKAKLKKCILLILFIFSILILLPTFISSLGTYAYTYKTILSEKSSNETYAHLLNALDNHANSYSNFPSISNNDLRGLDGFGLHEQADSNDSESNTCHVWNRWAGYDTEKSYRTTAFCYHATVSCSHDDNLRKIRGILIIDDGKIDYVWTENFNNNNDKHYKGESSVSASNNTYLQKMLANLYVSQNNYDVAWDCANYYMYSDARNTWVSKVANELWGNQDNVNRIARFNVPSSYSGDSYRTNNFSNDYAWNQSDNNNYKYKAIFIFSDTAGGQGTFYYRVVRENKKPKYNLEINKIETVDGNRLPGARFRIELTNVESIESYEIAKTKGDETQNPPRIVYAETDGNGQIRLNGIVPDSVESDITIRITEVEVPNANGYYYKKLDNPVNVKINKGTNSGHTERVTIENQSYIDLGGKVWLDGQKDEKAPKEPNGKKDNNENGIEGVLVALYNAKPNGELGTLVNLKGVKNPVLTNSNGEYMFEGIPKTKDGYRILFSYDGINWQETRGVISEGTGKKATDIDSHSDAIETNRANTNNKFKTISKGNAISTENKTTSLGYTYTDGVAKVNIDMAGNTPGTSDKKFQVNAQTIKVYKEKDTNIDCGLVKKEVDLALGTDVKSATVKINGKETNYTYAQIMDGVLNFQDKSSGKNDVTYNLNLYKSDYNYRIGNYLKDGAINNIQNNGDEKNITAGNELEVYVKYNVALKNQTPFYSATVNEFVYYYDEIYKPNGIGETDKYEVAIDEKNRKITFTTKGNGLELNEDNNYRIDIGLEFSLNKESDKYKDLLGKSFEVKNAAEITKYSTVKGGLIDKDSEPGNAGIAVKDGTWNVGKYEDDSDEARGLNISVDNNRVRKITGTVFDDTKSNDEEGTRVDADGKMENNAPVNDVIVQLIEVKKIGETSYYEYIWQQTKSGSGFVDKLSTDGKSIARYDNEYAKDEGYYEFKDYIPANYIIRYIYGDGTTYDITSDQYKDSAEIVKKYNGQDYKSTVDNKYKEQWYNTAGYKPEEEYSVARDNEARRLEVMAYSTTIDNVNGEALERRNKEDLSNTWMCAETSRINVPVDADNKNIVSDNATASYNYTKNKDRVEFSNMNFGLAERPRTNLVLEKHITGLKITPSGTGVQSIVDAKANIESIIIGSSSGTVDGGTIEVDGVTQGLSTIKSTRGNRGFWQVATDVEELAQGAELEVEYTYVIRNDSEKDYLSSDLVNAYIKGFEEDQKSYNEVLKEIKDTVKVTMRNGAYSYSENNTIGQYLGQYYYNGKTEGCAEVPSRIETLEEALNNSLTFDETSGEDFSKKTTTDEETMKTIYDTNGNTKTETITTIIESAEPADILTPSDTKDKNGKQEYVNNDEKKTADYSKKVTLRTVLSSSTGGELGANLPSYIAEVVKYSNAAGRRDMDAEPANLSYVHSDDTRMTMESDNERDEFWGESIIITKPTGEDKLTPIQITIITVSSMAVLGVGIVLIKKFLLKK